MVRDLVNNYVMLAADSSRVDIFAASHVAAPRAMISADSSSVDEEQYWW